MSSDHAVKAQVFSDAGIWLDVHDNEMVDKSLYTALGYQYLLINDLLKTYVDCQQTEADSVAFRIVDVVTMLSVECPLTVQLYEDPDNHETISRPPCTLYGSKLAAVSNYQILGFSRTISSTFVELLTMFQDYNFLEFTSIAAGKFHVIDEDGYASKYEPLYEVRYVVTTDNGSHVEHTLYNTNRLTLARQFARVCRAFALNRVRVYAIIGDDEICVPQHKEAYTRHDFAARLLLVHKGVAPVVGDVYPIDLHSHITFLSSAATQLLRDIPELIDGLFDLYVVDNDPVNGEYISRHSESIRFFTLSYFVESESDPDRYYNIEAEHYATRRQAELHKSRLQAYWKNAGVGLDIDVWSTGDTRRTERPENLQIDIVASYRDDSGDSYIEHVASAVTFHVAEAKIDELKKMCAAAGRKNIKFEAVRREEPTTFTDVRLYVPPVYLDNDYVSTSWYIRTCIDINHIQTEQRYVLNRSLDAQFGPYYTETASLEAAYLPRYMCFPDLYSARMYCDILPRAWNASPVQLPLPRFKVTAVARLKHAVNAAEDALSMRVTLAGLSANTLYWDCNNSLYDRNAPLGFSADYAEKYVIPKLSSCRNMLVRPRIHGIHNVDIVVTDADTRVTNFRFDNVAPQGHVVTPQSSISPMLQSRRVIRID